MASIAFAKFWIQNERPLNSLYNASLCVLSSLCELKIAVNFVKFA